MQRGGLLGHLARAPSFEEGPLSRQKITSIVFSNLSSKVTKLPWFFFYKNKISQQFLLKEGCWRLYKKFYKSLAVGT